MAIQEIIAQAKQINVSDLISRYVALEKASSHEWQGGCPKCGGSDRLHCSEEWWFCRQCHVKRGDAIDFMRWMDGSTFKEATEKLTNQPWPERKPHINQPKVQRMDDREEAWFDNAAKALKLHQLKLPGSEGVDYLRGRGLQPATWAAFGLGFAAEYPAIAMPWYRGGKITAIRYRLLNPHGKQKIKSLPGSKFGSVLFGAQALPDWVYEGLQQPIEGYRGVDQHCTLVLCEGEINAMSIWQVAHGSNLHVMSVGSETEHLSAGAIAFAQRYGQVIIWMDKEEKVKKVMPQVLGAFGFSSPQGKDANDLLQAGNLGGQLVALRWQAARTDDERHRLFWDIWDNANEGGIDASTMAAFCKLCPYMGREMVLIESEPGVWVTAQRAMAA